MRIISEINDIHIEEKTAVALGKFDGLHIGHQKLLRKIIEKKKEGYLATVFTFNPSPVVFFGGNNVKELTTVSEKREIFESMGIDILIEFPLNEESAKTLPEDYITQILVQKMNMGYMVSGSDVSFGYKGLGNARLLQEFSRKFNYETEFIDKVQIGEHTVSSTLIRELVKASKMEEVETLLGSAYSVEGEVLHGKALGRTIGFPTLNITPEEGKLLPLNGVYATRVYIDGERYDAVSNIGSKPTVSQNEEINVESHLFNFNQDAYGKCIRVELCKFMRTERRFCSVEELKNQIQSDKQNAELFWTKMKNNL